MIRVRRALLAAALSVVLGSPALAAPDPCADRLIDDGDGWTTIKAPAFAAGGARITSYVVDPAARDRIWVTNGTQVMASADGGCVFADAYTAPAGATVTALSWAGRAAYASVDAPGGPRVLGWSGSAFADRSAGLPPAGVPGPVAGNDLASYVLVRAGHVAQLFRAAPGGTGWTVVAPPLALPGNETVPSRLLTSVHPDPVDPETLWGVVRLPDAFAALGMNAENLRGGGAEGLYRSTDGGVTWTQMSDVTSTIVDVDVHREPGAAHGTVFAYMALVRTVWTSDDTGESWAAHATPGTTPVSSATYGASASDLVVTLPGAVARVYRYDATASIWRPIRHGGPQIDDLSAAGTTFFGRTAEGIVRFVVPRPPAPPRGGSPALPPDTSRCWDYTFAYGMAPPPGHGDERPRTLRQLPDAGPAPAVVPGQRRVVVPVGGSRRVPVLVTPRRTPVDLFFLVDDTGSMGVEICAVARSVQATVARLAAAGLDARFGLAEFGDYPPSALGDQPSPEFTIPPGEGNSEETHPYQLRRKVGLANDELAEKFAELRAGWGGARPEATLTALYQAVTGAGQDSPPAGPSRADIPARHDAGFRPEAQKFILTVTDAPMHDGPADTDDVDWPGPTYPEVLAALRAADVRVIGLSTASDEAPLPDLRAVATATGAVTPVDLDCNGDSLVDLPAGQPAVCEVDGETTAYFDMASAMTSLVRSVPDPAALTLDVAATDGVRATLDRATRRVNLKLIQRVPFALDVACERPGPARVRLTQQVAGVAAAAGHVDVECVGAPPVAPAGPPAAVVPPPPLPVPPQPPAPAPRIEVGGQVNPQAQAQSQAQSQANPNAAAVVQRQEQPQVAGVTVANAREQLATSRRFRPARRRPAPSPLPLAGAALAMAFAYGVHLARSPARQPR